MYIIGRTNLLIKPTQMFIIIVFFLLSVFGRDRNLKDCDDFKNSTSSLEFVDKYQLKIPIASEEIELSLNEFLSLFVLDNAPYGIHRYK